MIKFILQRYASPTGQEQQLKDQPTTHSQNPQTNRSTVALRNLKQTEDNIEILRRRLSVLQIRDQKNQNKARQNERKWQLHSHIQNQILKNKRRKQKLLNKKNSDLSKSKQKIQLHRNQRNQDLASARQNRLNEKRMQYKNSKNQSLSHSRSIEKMKIQDINNKSTKAKQIKEIEKLQRQHIEEYFFHKRSHFRENSARYGSQYDSRRSNRQKLLEQLSNRESQLIQRQSTSRAALDESTQRLYKVAKMKTKAKQQKSTTDLSQKLPPLSSRNTQQYLFL